MLPRSGGVAGGALMLTFFQSHNAECSKWHLMPTDDWVLL